MNPTQTAFCPYPTSHLTPRALNQCEWWRFRGEWTAPGVICRITDSVHARSDRTPTYYQQRHITRDSGMIWHVLKRQEKNWRQWQQVTIKRRRTSTSCWNARTELSQHKIPVASQRPHVLLLLTTSLSTSNMNGILKSFPVCACVSMSTCVHSVHVCEEIRIIPDIHLLCSWWGDWVGLGDMMAHSQRITFPSLPFSFALSNPNIRYWTMPLKVSEPSI